MNVNYLFLEIGAAVSWPRPVEFTTGCLRFRHPLLQRNIRLELTLNGFNPFYVVVLPTTELPISGQIVAKFYWEWTFRCQSRYHIYFSCQHHFSKKEKGLQLHNRIQFLSWTRIPSAHINLSSIPPLLININNLYWIDWELLSHRLAKNKIGRPSGSLTIPRSNYPSGPVCPYTDKIIVDRFTRP